MFRPVSLAQKLPRSEALLQALQTRVSGVKRLRRYFSSVVLCRNAAHSTAIQDGLLGAGQRAETLPVRPDLECEQHSCAQPARTPPPAPLKSTLYSSPTYGLSESLSGRGEGLCSGAQARTSPFFGQRMKLLHRTWSHSTGLINTRKEEPCWG